MAERIVGQCIRRLSSVVHRPSSVGEHNDPATENDLSFDDALLDAQLRRFFRIEFGPVEPPKGVFLKVLDTIERCIGESGKSKANCTGGQIHAFKRAYRALVEPYLARLTSGGVAVALLVMLVSAGGFPLNGAGRNAALSPTSMPTRQLRANLSERIADQAYVAQVYDVYVYDPAELGRFPLKREGMSGANNQAPAEYHNRLDSTGAQF